MESQDIKKLEAKSFTKNKPLYLKKEDLRRFSEGTFYALYQLLGAHKKVINKVQGVLFSIWTPRAKEVHILGSFTPSLLKLNRNINGVFELFVPGVKEGDSYCFHIVSSFGKTVEKIDPCGFYFCKRPEYHTKVFDLDAYQFKDQKWMEERKKKTLSSPMNIYEVHLGSFKKELQDYRSLAHGLADYVLKMGYTHIELLPITEHPLDESWGYQVTGFFAPTSRFGSPGDFQYFVDYLHSKGIGVILDWVGAHFPLNTYSLDKFDGQALYEYEDPLKGFHPVWNTAMFNFKRPEVCNFLTASILLFLDKFHIDGIRMDAVSSMLYLDHERKKGEWKVNSEGGNLNFEAIGFIRHLTETVKLKYPDVLFIAEESTAFEGVTQPSTQNGLGFDLKWNMGFMNDTLQYFSKTPAFRKHSYDQLCFSHTYSFTEQFLLPYSHDEVVHEKKSLFAKMPSAYPFSELKLFLMYQFCHPGKKLNFMGTEIAQKVEWDCKDEVSWFLLKEENHAKFQKFVQSLNFFYQEHSALWERDFSKEGFEWVYSDAKRSVVGFFRKSAKETLLCLFHFSEEDVLIPIDTKMKLTLLFNSKQEDNQWEKDGFIILSPFSARIFGVQFVKEDHHARRIP